MRSRPYAQPVCDSWFDGSYGRAGQHDNPRIDPSPPDDIGTSLATLGAGGAALSVTYRLGDLVATLAIVLPIVLLVWTNTFGAVETRVLLFRFKAALALLSTGMAARGRDIKQKYQRPDNQVWGEARTLWFAKARPAESGKSSIA
jgi:hypothetical protein